MVRPGGVRPDRPCAPHGPSIAAGRPGPHQTAGVLRAVGAVLGFAVGVGISPFPIVAVILLLFSPRARTNGPVFLAGWCLTLTVLATAMYLLADVVDLGGGGSSDGTSWLKLALGVVLLGAAYRKWRTEPEPGAEPELPGWMQGIGTATPRRAARLSVLLGLNPKNLLLSAGAASSLADVGPTAGEAAVAIVVFVVVGSAAVIVAVAYDAFGGPGARARLDAAKAWLTQHNGAVLTVLYLVFGAYLVAQSLQLR